MTLNALSRRGMLFSLPGIALVCGSCGGAPTPSITGSDSVPDAGPRILSGLTGLPILHADIVHDGQWMTIGAPGYFSLRTHRGMGDVYLWPTDDGFISSAYTRFFVYRGLDPGMLYRLPPQVRHVSVVLDDHIAETPWAVQRVEGATQSLTQLHGVLSFDISGLGDVVIPIVLDPLDRGFELLPHAAMLAYTMTNDQGVIFGGRIVVRSLAVESFWYGEENFKTAILHELIHITGLDHLQSGELGIMSGNSESYRFPVPTEREILVMRMQYRRSAGTILSGMIETEREVAAASSPSNATWRLVCAR